MQRLYSLIIFTFLYFLMVSSPLANDLPDGFVYVKDVIPSIQLDMRYYTKDNFVGTRINGYESPKCILSKEAATALRKVQDELEPFGLGLKVYDAYRPQQAVDHFVKWAKDLNDTKMKSKYYPNVKKENIFRDGYIAEKSGHSRGSTVDLTIISLNENGAPELDMGSRWDFFDTLSWGNNMTITSAQRANRMLLQLIMIKHGFKPLKEEWWHFTLNDEPFPNEYFNFLVK